MMLVSLSHIEETEKSLFEPGELDLASSYCQLSNIEVTHMYKSILVSH